MTTLLYYIINIYDYLIVNLNQIKYQQLVNQSVFSITYLTCPGDHRMVVRFTTTYAISADHHESCEFEHYPRRGVLYTTLCDKVCHSFATSRWFSPGTPVSSTNITDHHDIIDLLLKVALNTGSQPTNHTRRIMYSVYIEHTL